MREKAGNPIGPPKSSIAIPTWGPNFNIHIIIDDSLDLALGPSRKR